jgi:type I restriction enzyme S subunit
MRTKKMSDRQPYEKVRLGDLITVKHGYPFKTEFISEDLSGRPILVNIGNFRYSGGFRFDTTRTREYQGSYPEDYELQPGDILLVMTCQTSEGEILGVPARVPNDGRVYLHNQRLGKVLVTRPDKVEPDYLYWLFLWHEFNHELFVTASGTKILHTAPKRIEGFEFGLPSIGEQRTIAKILWSLEKKIELNEQMNGTLEAIAQTLFRHWFVDFEFPNEEGKPYKSSGGEITDSELGEIPLTWRSSKIGDVLKTVLGGTPDRANPEFWGGEIPWINSGKINEFRITEPTEYITERGLENSATKLLPKETTVLAITGATLGQVSLLEIDSCTNQSVIGVLESKELPSEYIYFWIKQHILEIIAWQTGGAQQHINKQNVSDSPLLIPSPEVLSAYVKIVRPLLDRIALNCFENSNLCITRDLLLPKLISGKMRVPFLKDNERRLDV